MMKLLDETLAVARARIEPAAIVEHMLGKPPSLQKLGASPQYAAWREAFGEGAGVALEAIVLFIDDVKAHPTVDPITLHGYLHILAGTVERGMSQCGG